MNSNHNEYIRANQEKERLFNNFSNLKTLYGMIFHMRRKYMSDKVAADFYSEILKKVIGRDTCGCLKDSLTEKDEFEEIFNKCNGLFTHFAEGEKDVVLNELKRLQETNEPNEPNARELQVMGFVQDLKK